MLQLLVVEQTKIYRPKLTENVYRHPTMPLPKIPRSILGNLLKMCTTEYRLKLQMENYSTKLTAWLWAVALGRPLPAFTCAI